MKNNLKPQHFAGSKSLFRKITTTATLALSLFSFNTFAQPFNSSCLSTQIDISTGLDHTGSLLPYPTSGSTQDPYWTITNVPTNTASITAPRCAELVDDVNANDAATLGGYPNAGSAYISYATTPTVANIGAGSGMFWTYHHSPGAPLNGSGPVRFTREFYIEGAVPQAVTINISGYGDDIVFIAFDATAGTPIYNTPSSPNLVYYNATTPTTTSSMTATATITLAPGAHTLDVDLYDIAGQISAISLTGTLSTSAPALALNSCYGQNTCGVVEPPSDCDDLCYWTVDGNVIHNGRNKFGTLSDDNIDIISNSTSRGIITTGTAAQGSSFLGWNTTAPTSIFHVDCMGNHDDGSGMSDIRFENLEHGDGNILVIDDMGHVFRTDYRIEDLMPHGKAAAANEDYDELKAKYETLQNELRDMKSALDELKNCCSSNSGYSDGASTTIKNSSKLYQNTPNPFGSETKIDYIIDDVIEQAYIAVFDLNGRELSRYDVSTKGKGQITIDGSSLKSGMYIYSLVIDGKEIDTKKMVFTSN